MTLLDHREPPPPGRRWRVKKWQAVIGVTLLVAAIAAALYLNSDAFQERIRRRVVAELENITGGEVELRSFSWNLSQLQFVIDDLTIHGLESKDEVPYAHVDRLEVRLKIFSIMAREVGLEYVGADRPVVHLVVYPDGSTNQPVPKIKRATQGRVDPVEQLFALQMDQLELKSGEVIFNDRRIPLNFSGENVSAGMSYVLTGDRYDGRIHIGRMLLDFRGGPQLPSTAEVQFSLFRANAELKSLHWSSPRSNFEASGRLTDFNDPRVELTYNASLDVAELGGAAGLREIRSGTVQINGSGNYTAAQLASSGKLLVRNLDYRTAGFALPNLNGGAQFSLTRDRFSLSSIFANAFGGTITGSLDVRDWLSSERPGKGTVDSSKDVPAPPQRGSGSFDVRGIQMRSTIAAFGRNATVDKLDPVGIAAGKVNVAWTGSPAHADAELALHITPPARVEPHQFPVQGEVLATYRGRNQLLDVRRLDLVTPHSTLNVAGSLGARDSQLQVELASRDISEFRSIIAALAPDAAPQELGGALTFRGTVRGPLTAPAIQGRIEAQNLHARLPQAKPDAPPIQWDSVAADLSYSQQGASIGNAQLRRGNTAINISGDVALTRGALAPDSPLNARVHATGAAIEELEQLAGVDLPLTGAVDFDITLAGTRAQPHAEGRVRVTGGDIMGEPYNFITANLDLAGNHARVTGLTLAQNGGRITGQFAYDLSSRQYQFDLRGAGFDLAHIRRLQSPRMDLAGTVRFEATGSGTFEQPIINGRLEASKLSANGEAIGNVVATAVTRGRELQLNAEAIVEQARLTAAGVVTLRDQFPADITLTLADFDFDPFLRAFFPGKLTGHSLIAGDITLRGPLKQPRLLAVEGNIERLNAEIENIKLSNQGPVRFAMRDQVLRLDQFRIVGDGTDFSARGSVGLAQPRNLDLRADGRLNLRVLQTFNPEVQSSGITTVAATVHGTVTDPRIVGQIEIENGNIALIDLPNGLSDINGTLVFDEDRLQVQSLRATTGGGQLDIGGFITYARVISFNLTAKGEGIRVRYPEGVSSVANADLRVSGNLKSALLAGDVTITRFGMTPRFDFALYLARSRQPVAVPDPTSVLNNIRLDVRVTSAPELQFQTSVARLSGDVDLRIRGTAARPAVLGRVTLAEGDISFNGTTYHLEHGDVTFTSPVGIEPVVNVTATARVREYDITLGFHGPANRMSTTYRSEPPLPVGDIIALLAFGRTREDAALQSQQSPQSLTETASNAILGQALNATLSQRAQRLFGISRIKIDPQVGGPEANPNARVTIEQQVSNWVTLTYITNLARSAEQIIQAEFIVSQNVSLLAVRDQNGVVGFDIRVRHRRR
jgi:translocation and assembly module TamB